METSQLYHLYEVMMILVLHPIGPNWQKKKKSPFDSLVSFPGLQIQVLFQVVLSFIQTRRYPLVSGCDSLGF